MKIVAIAAVLALGCKSEPKPEPPPPPPKPVVDGVDLVSTGSPPRREVRYRLAKDARAELELGLDVDLTTVEGVAQLPTLAMSLELLTTQLEPDGGGRIRSRVTAASAVDRPGASAALALMNAQAALLVGLEATAQVSPLGELAASKIDATGRDLSPAVHEQAKTLLQSLEQLAMPLPAEPIGVGAVWTYRKTIQLNQLTMVATTRVEVTGLADDQLGFASTTQLTGEPQTITLEQTTAQVTSLGGTGSGRGSIDLAHVTMTGEQRAELGFEMMLGSDRRATRMVMVTRLGPASEPAAGSGAGGSAAGSAGSASATHDDQGAHSDP
ncbi:MAG: hypothetical protein H0X17_17130 [Deltaproteobacteria bacterium]|nr:hypothetical protein [Deltaproteobacteria bacterium]